MSALSPAPLASATEAARDRLRRACASLDLAELTGSPFAMSQALVEVARSHRELNDEAAAELHFAAAVRWARLLGSVDQLAELLDTGTVALPVIDVPLGDLEERYGALLRSA